MRAQRLIEYDIFGYEPVAVWVLVLGTEFVTLLAVTA
jgi:hypothetical protein